MRPMVEQAQGVPKLAPRLMHPRTRAGIRALHGALWAASRPALRGLAGRLFGGQRAEPDLARYRDGGLSSEDPSPRAPFATPSVSSRSRAAEPGIHNR